MKSFTGAGGAASLKSGAGEKKYRCVCGGAGQQNATAQRETDAFSHNRWWWGLEVRVDLSASSCDLRSFPALCYLSLLPLLRVNTALADGLGRTWEGSGRFYVSTVEKHTGMLWVGHRAVVENVKVLCERLR